MKPAFLSGAEGRQWRRQIAASAKRTDDTMRTLKFKLDLGSSPLPFSFDEAVSLYNINEGTGKGSLTGLLMRAQLNGFRVFMKEDDATAFRNASVFRNDEFIEDFSGQSGLHLRDFTPEQIYKRINKEVRARGGKDNSFTAETIAREYCLDFTGKRFDENTPEDIAAFLKEIGEVIAANFSGWADLKQNNEAVFRCIDGFFANKGWKLPSLSAMAAQLQGSAAGASTLAFDPALSSIADTADIEPHLLIALRLRDAHKEGVEQKKLAARVQQMMTGDNHAGLSWLFGNGLRYLRSVSLADFMRDFGVPQERVQGAREVLEYAAAIPPNPVFPTDSYSEFRMTVGGRLASWTANYLNRLLELRTLIDKAGVIDLPVSLKHPEASEFFSGLGMNAETLFDLIASLAADRSSASGALDRLLGKGEVPSRADIAAVETYADQLDAAAGMIGILMNRLKQEVEFPVAPEIAQLAAACTFKQPDWLTRLPALNRLRGGVPDYRFEIEAAVADFFATQLAMKQHLKEIAAYCAEQGATLDPLAALAKSEQHSVSRMKASLERAVTNPCHRALAIVLQRFSSAARNCSAATVNEVVALIRSWNIVSDPRDLNRYFRNRNGAFHRSAFAASRHQAYKLDFAQLESIDLLGRIGSFIDELEERIGSREDVDWERTADALRLERMFSGVMLAGLTIPLPFSLAKPRMKEGLARQPGNLMRQLGEEMVAPSVVQRAFNLYQSALSGLNVLVSRPSFILRTRFQRVGDTGIVYAPKATDWQVPERLKVTDKAIRSILDDDAMVWDEGMLDVESSLKALFKRKPELSRPVADFMMQAPHDWCYSLGTRSVPSQRMGVIVRKGTMTSSIRSYDNAYRMIGPSSYKNILDRFLTEPQRYEAGDITVIVDNAFTQKVALRKFGKASVEIEDKGYTISIAIPISEGKPEKAPEFPLAKNYVAIDQGERGLAYAVFDSATHQLKDSGTVPIPSIRNLIKAATRYRKAAQPNQKFQQRFDSTMFVMRENVVGDVCHVICGLMAKHKAFPILESTVGNLESGSRQLDLVYKSVNARFLFSDVLDHKTTRKAFWCGAETWEHPTLEQRERNEQGVATGKIKPLFMFPGVGVPPRATSQRCSCCGKNPYEAIRRMEAAGVRHFQVKGGKIQLDDGLIELFALPEEEGERKQFRRRNQRPPLSRPISDGKHDIPTLMQIVKRNLRRPHPSLQSKDTTQSQFHCVYAGCRHQIHADENAALNIGWKFKTEKLA